jgi:hypothetical protein
MLQPWMNADDLAPGDAKCARLDWTGFELHRIRSRADPYFWTAFEALWREFGAHGEMEQADVIERRLRWDPRQSVHGCALLYELLLVTRDGGFVAVRDHTAIVRADFPMAVVHMSHNLVAPAFRRVGIAGWLRALPAQTARDCLCAQGHSSTEPIALVAEMEPADPANEARTIRLTAYERAGYQKINPDEISYLQPDFRHPEEIDTSGGPRPVRLDLLVRLVGDESRSSLRADQVRGIVESLYRMYGAEFRPADMAVVWEHLARFPRGDHSIALLPPTQA